MPAVVLAFMVTCRGCLCVLVLMPALSRDEALDTSYCSTHPEKPVYIGNLAVCDCKEGTEKSNRNY